MSNTLSTRDQLARDLYVHNQGETPHSAFETADAFMVELARRSEVISAGTAAPNEVLPTPVVLTDDEVWAIREYLDTDVFPGYTMHIHILSNLLARLGVEVKS